MYKRFLIFIFITLLVVITGCNTNDYSITTYKQEPRVGFVNESEIIITNTLLVYHKDGFVKKTEMVVENVLKDGDTKDLNLYSAGIEETFKMEVFNIKGFSYSSELTDTAFIFKTTYDYTKIDIKQVLEDGKELIHVKDVVNEDYEIPYDIYSQILTESGFVIELAD